jgi:hypothetical protein
MSGELEPTEPDLPHEVADMERIGSGIEPYVGTDRSFTQSLRERSAVGGVVHEASCCEIVDEATDGRRTS